MFLCLNLFVLRTHGIEPLRDSLQKCYTSQVGTREATNNNDGVRVENYLSVSGLGKGNPWCASFVAWNFKQVGIKAPNSAYSPDWFRTNIVYKKSWQKTDYKSKKGQVFGLWYESKKRIAHVGFIDSEDKNNYYTVEGNTNEAGSREGDGVYRKIRSKKSVYIISDYCNEKN